MFVLPRASAFVGTSSMSSLMAESVNFYAICINYFANHTHAKVRRNFWNQCTPRMIHNRLITTVVVDNANWLGRSTNLKRLCFMLNKPWLCTLLFYVWAQMFLLVSCSFSLQYLLFLVHGQGQRTKEIKNKGSFCQLCFNPTNKPSLCLISTVFRLKSDHWQFLDILAWNLVFLLINVA